MTFRFKENATRGRSIRRASHEERPDVSCSIGFGWVEQGSGGVLAGSESICSAGDLKSKSHRVLSHLLPILECDHIFVHVISSSALAFVRRNRYQLVSSGGCALRAV
jgi:hypothetical protein